MATLKKKREEDAWMWMTQPHPPGMDNASFLTRHVTSDFKLPSFQPFNFHASVPGTSFIENYIAYFLLPTPLEQIGTLFDPLQLQDPHHRYVKNPWNLLWDVHADYRGIKGEVIPPEPASPPGMLDIRFFRSLVPFF